MQDFRRVLILCAHSDDQAIGAGGTIAKFSSAGVDVKTFIFSFGELSHPHLQEMEVRKTRVQESQDANKILGGTSVIFLGMREGKFPEEYSERKWYEKLLSHIHSFRPDCILTHAPDDLHPDHRAVYKIVMDVYERGKLTCDLYAFDIWTVLNVKKRHVPCLVVDISQTFTKKIDALSAFRSQKVALFTLLWSVYAKAIFWGLRRGVRYAEVFYKLR